MSIQDVQNWSTPIANCDLDTCSNPITDINIVPRPILTNTKNLVGKCSKEE